MIHATSNTANKLEGVSPLAVRFRQVSQVIAFLVVALGLLIFCGWAFNVPALTYIRPRFQSMKVNTALCFMCLGAGLWLAHNDKRQHSRRILGLLVVIISGLTLAEYAFHVSLGIDELLFRDTRSPSLSAYPGRMAIATAISFLFLGSAIAFLGLRKAVVLQRAAVYLCFAFSLVALCGYLYGVKPLYSITALSTVGLHTAAGLMAVSLAYFLARPDEGIVSIAASGSSSGFLLRTIIPAIIVVPILIGWLRLAGQRANLYDTEFGVALQVFGSVGCLAALTMLIVRSMHQLERERGRVQETLKTSEEKFSRAFRGSPVIITLTSARDHRYLDVSENFELWTGWSRDEVIGRTPSDIEVWVDPGERSEFEKRLLAEGVVRNFEVRYRHKDGTERIGLGSGELINIGNERCMISTIADITEHNRMVRAVQESEERFRLIANSAPVMLWTSGQDKMCTFCNQGWLNFTGRSIEQELGEGWASGVHPDDRDRCLGTYSAAFDSRVQFEMEFRFRRSDGEYRWIVSYGVPRFQFDGTFVGYIGSCIDITDRKLSEDALRDMSGRMITAQEEERARIARELHDDLSQRMALLQIGLEEFEQESRRLSAVDKQRLHKIAEVATEISSDIHDLSHDLHPSKLDTLGLVPALEGTCREFSNQHGLKVQFVLDRVDGQVPKDVTLCVFRIVQEALRNVVKHSGASEAKVELTSHNDRIELTVSDSGVGFDPEANQGITGIGLISMRERLRLVNGTIEIQSKPTGGTTVRVRVPFRSEQASRRAAG